MIFFRNICPEYFAFKIYEGRRKLFMYNVKQKFKIQITLVITVLVYNITVMQQNVPKATSH